MKVLIAGATGFLGRHLVDALAAEGHQVVCAVRDPAAARRRRPDVEHVRVDFLRAGEPGDWLPLLDGVQVVINAVGILRERGAQTFDALHRRAPCALFAACVEAGVGQVLQISALGADEAAASGYHLSKRAADEFLLGLPIRATVLQPSLVYGADGTSAQLFGMLASLPLIPLPGAGGQRVQPVHVDDLAAAVIALVRGERAPPRLPVVGPEPLSLRDFLARLRRAMGLRAPARFLPMPMSLVEAGARMAARLPGSLLDADTLEMLRRGNTADPAPMQALLGHAPRPVERFVSAPHARAVRSEARASWLLPVLRASVGLVWIVTGILSLGVYPVEASFALLAQSGVPGPLRPFALFGAGLLDLVLGILTFLPWQRRKVLFAQAALILGYTAIITWKLPEFWLHPYGPILKNLPMLAAIWLLAEMEER